MALPLSVGYHKNYLMILTMWGGNHNN